MNVLRPLADFVLIKLDPEQAMRGLLHVPEAHRSKPVTGTVVAAGPGYARNGKFKPTHVRPGQRAQFHKHHGTEITLAGERHIVVTEEHIHGVWE